MTSLALMPQNKFQLIYILYNILLNKKYTHSKNIEILYSHTEKRRKKLREKANDAIYKSQQKKKKKHFLVTTL